MKQELAGLSESERWKLLLNAAIRAAESNGYGLTRLPGRGRYSVYTVERDGATEKACIRTTRDRLIAFPPVTGGKRWKTLDDVKHVIVSTVDSKANPRNIEVYMFRASDVRQRFNEAYRARKQQGIFTEDKFGFWLGLDKGDRGGTYSTGSGIVDDLPKCRVAVYKIADLLSGAAAQMEVVPSAVGKQCGYKTIGDVMAWARQQVATLAGVNVEAVKLDMKLEY